ncbi:MAG: 16S rRNA (cytidine(1402)-2'-O)-methyltransferase, partial [Candidatus Binataceae bacterium]
GVLYVVATPLGNLGDISARAIEILRTADLIACEDTRRTAVILNAHEIGTPTISYFEHNEERRIPDLIAKLRNGAKIAIVTDAGTPGISDPGFRLVRAAHDAKIRVLAIPGPSAVIAALSIAGLPTDRFVFEGFLPQRSSARRRILKELSTERRTLVFFEAARRLAETASDMAEIFGADRQAAIVREMTKTFEETARGALGELAQRYSKHPALGEVSIVVEGASAVTGDVSSTRVEVTVDALCGAGLGLKEATVIMARLNGVSRRELYQKAIRDRSVKN